MTILVGIRCTDGVVIAADSGIWLGPSTQQATIEQTFENKIQIIDDRVIVATSGHVGHCQRFTEVVRQAWRKKEFQKKTALEIGKLLSHHGIQDFAQTQVQRKFDFGSLIAYQATDGPALCELSGGSEFQPELKVLDGLWYGSLGSGASLSDPFLALLREVFWSEGPPNVQGGVFSALWALRHTVATNIGGVRDPIHISTLSRQKGQFLAHQLDEDQKDEHNSMIAEATKHFGEFKDILLGEKSARTIPKP